MPTPWIGTTLGCSTAPAARASVRKRLRLCGMLDELRGDHLQGDVTVEVELMGAVDDSHAAPADDPFDAAPSEERAWSQDAHAAYISEALRERERCHGRGAAREVMMTAMP